MTFPARTAPSTVRALATAALTPSRLSLARAGAGTAMIVSPAALARLMRVEPATAASTSWVAQMLGARELALGVGAFTALRRKDRRSHALWLAAGLLCDAVDAVVLAFAVGRGRVPAVPGTAVVAVATAAAAAQAAALARS